jgi:hypothetical protein
MYCRSLKCLQYPRDKEPQLVTSVGLLCGCGENYSYCAFIPITILSAIRHLLAEMKLAIKCLKSKIINYRNNRNNYCLYWIARKRGMTKQSLRCHGFTISWMLIPLTLVNAETSRSHRQGAKDQLSCQRPLVQGISAECEGLFGSEHVNVAVGPRKKYGGDFGAIPDEST